MTKKEIVTNALYTALVVSSVIGLVVVDGHFTIAQLKDFEGVGDTATKYYKSVWYRKWEVKWLALADTFKEG